MSYEQPARKPRTDLNSLIRRVLLLLGQQLDRTGIEVHASLSLKLPKVLAVADHIHQVILSLVSNSIEAMPDGGQLFVETNGSTGSVRVMVEDTGPGIPQEGRDRIFEPILNSKERRIGIGLSVSYGIITVHGGV